MAGEISPLVASLNVAVGGAAGSVLRYHAGRAAHNLAPAGSAFPWGTLAVNVAGSLLMGLLIGWLARGTMTDMAAESTRLLLGVGLLGGFSAFSAELVTMLHRGQIGMAGAYVAVSLVAGMAAVLAGLVTAQSIAA